MLASSHHFVFNARSFLFVLSGLPPKANIFKFNFLENPRLNRRGWLVRDYVQIFRSYTLILPNTFYFCMGLPKYDMFEHRLTIVKVTTANIQITEKEMIG